MGRSFAFGTLKLFEENETEPVLKTVTVLIGYQVYWPASLGHVPIAEEDSNICEWTGTISQITTARPSVGYEKCSPMEWGRSLRVSLPRHHFSFFYTKLALNKKGCLPIIPFCPCVKFVQCIYIVILPVVPFPVQHRILTCLHCSSSPMMFSSSLVPMCAAFT